MKPSEFIELKHIETLLLCGICYEFMETTVSTPCSHNFCSLCIRKYLHYKTQCPACFENIFEKDLRVNKVVNEITLYFLQLKEKLEKCIQNVSSKPLDIIHSPIKLKSYQDDSTVEKLKVSEDVQSKTTQQCSINDAQRIENSLVNIVKHMSSPSTSGTSKLSNFFSPKSKKVCQGTEKILVSCPVCSVNVSETNINRHLDDCLKREVQIQKPFRVQPKRKPLPKLVFSLMKDIEIKRKLKDFGLSHIGDRKILESRLQRYITLYNAECDKEHPRPISELIKRCDEEENLEKKANKSIFTKLQVNRNTAEHVIEEERKKYLELHKDSFNNLISKLKSVHNSKQSSARRSLLQDTDNNTDTSYAVHSVNQSTTEKNDINTNNCCDAKHYTSCVDDPDSSFLSPLQKYSSEDPMRFLTVKLPINSQKKEQLSDLQRIQSPDSSISEVEKVSSNNSNYNCADESSLLFSDVPYSDSDIDRKEKLFNRGTIRLEKNICEESKCEHEINSQLEEQSTNLEKNEENDFITTIAESDLSSNDSIVDRSDTEISETKLMCKVIEDLLERRNILERSKLDKENLNCSVVNYDMQASPRKRNHDSLLNEEADTSKWNETNETMTSQSHDAICSKKINLSDDQDKKTKRTRREKKELLVVPNHVSQRKSSRLKSKANFSVNDSTMGR